VPGARARILADGVAAAPADAPAAVQGGLGQTLLGGAVEDSTALERVGDPGPGRWLTV
jgi:hypothetical protein